MVHFSIQKEITPSVFEAIQDAKAAGVKIVITTGRPIAGGLKTFKRTPFDGSLETMSLPLMAVWFKKPLLEKNSSRTF